MTEEFASFVVSVLEDKRAEEIVWLDVSEVTDLADYFIVATVNNPRQMSAISAECEIERKRLGLARVGLEGVSNSSSWVVMDYGDLVVHLFLPEQREYYQLEHLWADAKRIPL